MNNQEILNKAIEKAIANGWTFFDWTDADDFQWEVRPDEDSNGGIVIHTEASLDEFWWHPNIIIFNHDFAKALWGLEPRWGGMLTNSQMIVGEGVVLSNIANCDYHLMQMVLADDHVKYLGENL